MSPGVRTIARGAVAAVIALLAAAAPVGAKTQPWPPADGPGKLFVHFGEEHINDADGATLLPKVVRQSSRYRPLLVTMSGDKADDGETEQLELWAGVMDIYDRKGIPWFAAVGNHDRDVPPGAVSGSPPPGSIEPYREFFADRPYPMGDAAGYDDPRIRPSERASADPDGAASHYFVDYGKVRWVFVDNSCWVIDECDLFQSPSGQNSGGDEPQFSFLKRVASEASEQGKLVFVVMHMPTRDPRDQSYAEPISLSHTMGKGALTDDNEQFEQVAEEAGVDGVFLGHIKGQFLYRGEGGVPYFVDGGAGGELYTTGPVGADHGYWHGYRLIRVEGDSFVTDTVPIFVSGGIEITGTKRVAVGERQTFEAFGRQPVFNDPAKVPALELRDPSPIQRSSSGGIGAWLGRWGPWLVPVLMFGTLIGLARVARMPAARRRVAVPAVACAATVAGFGGISAAQQGEPTSTPVESLPNPARMWTSSNPQVLRPVASETDDDRRNPRTQTADGTFRGACPGRARLTIASGFEEESLRVTVPSDAGQIVGSIKRGADTVRAGNRATVARVTLEQRARVLARVFRDGRRIATIQRSCSSPGVLAIGWDGTTAGANADQLKPRRYRVQVRVLSDRSPVKRSFVVRVLG